MSFWRRIRRAVRPQDIVPSISRAIRPQDIVPSVKRAFRPQDIIPSIQNNAREFSQWAEERWEVLAKWVTEKALHLYMTKPEVYWINAHKTGEPVYFVNGILNSLNSARNSAEELSEKLGRPVGLIWNPSFSYPHSEQQRQRDLQPDLAQCLLDKAWMPPLPQHNLTTKQLAYLLYHSKGRVSLVAHSQGGIIASNAILTLSFLGEGEWLRKKLRLVTAGSPIPDVWVNINRYKAIWNPGDVVATWIGLKGGRHWLSAQFTKHSFTENYKDQIENKYLWNSGSSSAPRNLEMFEQRRLVVENATNDEITIEATILHNGRWAPERSWRIPAGASSWGPTNRDDIEFGSQANFDLGSQAIFIASSCRRQWRRSTSEPLVLCDAPYKAEKVGDYILRLATSSDPENEQASIVAVGRHADDAGSLESQWVNVRESGAFYRPNNGPIEIFTMDMNSSWPVDANGQPFYGCQPPFPTTESLRHGDYFIWKKIAEKSRNYYAYPKSNEGHVWIWEWSTKRWRKLLCLSPYRVTEDEVVWPDEHNQDSQDIFDNHTEVSYELKVTKLFNGESCGVSAREKIRMQVTADGVDGYDKKHDMQAGGHWVLNKTFTFKHSLAIEFSVRYDDSEEIQVGYFMPNCSSPDIQYQSQFHFQGLRGARYFFEYEVLRTILVYR